MSVYSAFKKSIQNTPVFLYENLLTYFCEGNKIHVKVSDKELSYINNNVVKLDNSILNLEKKNQKNIQFANAKTILKRWYGNNVIPQNTDVYLYKNLLYVLNGNFILKSELGDSIGNRSSKIPNIFINALIEDEQLKGCYINDYITFEFDNIVIECRFMNQNMFCDIVDNFISSSFINSKKGLFTGSELESIKNVGRFYVNGLSETFKDKEYSYSSRLAYINYLESDVYFSIF